MIYRLVVISHVLAAIVGLGCIAAVPVLRTSTAPEVHLQVEMRLAQRVMTPALAWSLVTGLVQVTIGPYAFGDIFVDVSLGLLLLLFGIAGAGITRTSRRSAGSPADVRLLTRHWQAAAAVGVIIVVLMVVKPQ